MEKEETFLQKFIQKQELLKKEILNPSELSQYTGLSKSYIYKLTHLREIPYYCSRGI